MNKKNKFKPVMIRNDDYKKLKEISIEEGRTMAEILRRSIEKYKNEAK